MRLLLAWFLSLSALAHPVIYQDGWVASHMSMADMSDTNLSYSLTAKNAIGFNYFRLTDAAQHDSEFELFKFNHLLKRFNGADSQSNIYLHSGLGRVESAIERDRLAWMGGVEVDWETRKYYTSVKYLHLGSSREDTGIVMGRVGISPLMADFQDLQAWAMVQVWHDPVTSREAKITPLLRFFYHNVLWEMGSSLKGDMMLNLMIHL